MDTEKRHQITLEEVLEFGRDEREIADECLNMPDTLDFISEEQIGDNETRLSFQCSCGKIVYEYYEKIVD